MILKPRRVPLASLAAVVGGELRGDGGVSVTDVLLDSRDVGPGSLFCCVPGARADGHDFAAAALAAGASALLVERVLDLPVPQVVVPAVRPVLPALADAFFDHPSRRLDLVGVTGTNGKTTTTYMLEAIARAAGLLPGVIGTVEVRIGDERRDAIHTTPEAPDLQRLLAAMAGNGVQLAAMEVSSHGLALGRVDATRFRASIFTNLTQDHLDFHPDMESYFQAKALLFTPAFTELAVVNVDDPYGARLAASAPVPVVTVGTGPNADWRATAIEASLAGTTFTVTGPASVAAGGRSAAGGPASGVASGAGSGPAPAAASGVGSGGSGAGSGAAFGVASGAGSGTAFGAGSGAGSGAGPRPGWGGCAPAVKGASGLSTGSEGVGGGGATRSATVRLALAGQFNAINALGAIAASAHLGIDLDTAVAGLAALPGVPGRFERVEAGQPFTVLVDYSHTPDSLENALRATRAVTDGRVLVVFGCGGDRDRAKRPIMGEIAGKLADHTLITSDNPRSEEPPAIVAEIAEGTRRTAAAGAWATEVDRRAAIAAAIAMARPGDAVLIAGKGHEQGQEFAGGRKVPFDDRVVAMEELARLRGGDGGAR